MGEQEKQREHEDIGEKFGRSHGPDRRRSLVFSAMVRHTDKTKGLPSLHTTPHRSRTKVALSRERQKTLSLCASMKLSCVHSYHIIFWLMNAIISSLPRSTLGVSFPVPSFVAKRVGWLPNNGFHGSGTRASGCLAQPSPTKRPATQGLVMYTPATRPVTRPNIVPTKSAHALPGARPLPILSTDGDVSESAPWPAFCGPGTSRERPAVAGPGERGPVGSGDLRRLALRHRPALSRSPHRPLRPTGLSRPSGPPSKRSIAFLRTGFIRGAAVHA